MPPVVHRRGVSPLRDGVGGRVCPLSLRGLFIIPMILQGCQCVLLSLLSLRHPDCTHVLSGDIQTDHMSSVETSRLITCPQWRHPDCTHVLSGDIQTAHMSSVETSG
ncbi:unnamed protein product [Pleuronectes platessa]|uniref:Uncharacterized protein n=1 Tax=Pleuronectes platessa TaxID=8262 RepID=A0A9N7YFA0_PLEPL|nr:unnamed protein product [Pleuronectes platessa]